MAQTIESPLYNTGLNNYQGSAPAYLVVDATVLSTLAGADPTGGLLNTLLNSGRQVVITNTVVGEINDPGTPQNRQTTINTWINNNSSRIMQETTAGDPIAGSSDDAGEISINNFISSQAQSGSDIRVLTDDLRWINGKNGLLQARTLAGTSGINLTSGEFLTDQLFSGSITPLNYLNFSQSLLNSGSNFNNLQQRGQLITPGQTVPLNGVDNQSGSLLYLGVGAILENSLGLPYQIIGPNGTISIPQLPGGTTVQKASLFQFYGVSPTNFVPSQNGSVTTLAGSATSPTTGLAVNISYSYDASTGKFSSSQQDSAGNGVAINFNWTPQGNLIEGINITAAQDPGVSFTSTPDSNGDGGSNLRFATPEEQATLSGAPIDPTQVTPNADGSFTFGSPMADPDGLVNQLNVNGAFGLSGLAVTNPVTGTVDMVPLDNGSDSDVQEGRSAATGVPNEQVQTTQANGLLQDVVFGQGAQANVSNTAVWLAEGTQAAVNGTGNSVDDMDDDGPVQEGRSVAIDGTNNNYQGQAGDSAQLDGGGNVTSNVSSVTLVGDGSSATTNGGSAVQLTASNQLLYADAGSIVTVSPSLQSENVFGSGLTLNADGLVYGNLVGNDDFFNDSDSGGTYYGIEGSGDIVSAQGDTFEDPDQGTLTLNGSGDSANVHSSNDTLNGSAGDTFNVDDGLQNETVYGSDLTVASSGTISTNITGSNDIVDAAAANGNIFGNDETLNFTADGGSGFGLVGDGDIVNATGDFFVDADGNTTLTLNGGGNTTLVETSGDTINDNSAGDTVDVSAGQQGEGIYGSGTTVNLAGNSGSSAGVYGTGITVTGDSGTDLVNLGGTGTNATVDGGGTVGLTASDEDVTLGDQGSTVVVQAGQQIEGIYGSGTTVDLAGSSGSSAGVQGTGIVVNGDSGNDLLNFNGDGTSATVYGGGDVGLLASDQIVSADAGSVVNVSPSLQNETVYGSYLTLNADGLSGGNLIGSDDFLNDANGGGTYYGIEGSGDIVTAQDGGFVDIDGGSTLTVNGTDNTTQVLNSGDTLNDNGAGDTVNLSPSLQNETINASDITVNADGLSGGNLVGSDDFLNDNDGGGSYYGIIGSGDIITAQGDGFVDIDGGSTLTVNGADDAIYDVASNETVYAAGTDTVNIGVNQQGETISGDGVVVQGDGSVNGNIFGNNDTLDLAGDGGSGVGLVGSGDVVNSTGNYLVDYDGGTTTTLNGGGNTIVVEASGDTVNGSGNMVDVAGAVGSVTVGGTNNTVDASSSIIYDGASNTSIVVEGQGNTIELSGTNQNIDISGENENLVLPGTGLSFSPYGDTITSSDDARVNLDDSSGQKLGSIGFTDGYESERSAVNGSTQVDSYFESSGSVTSEDYYNNNSEYMEDDYSGVGADFQTTQIDFNGSVATSDALFNPTNDNPGYNYETITYSGNTSYDNTTSEAFFSSQGPETEDILFNSSGQNYQTNFYDGVSGNDLETNEETFNSSGWETDDYIFNSSEQNVQTIVYSGYSGNDYEFALEDFNSSDAEVQQIDFNPDGQSYQLIDYSGNPYDDNQTYSESYGSDYSYGDGYDSSSSSDGYDSYDDEDGGYDFAKGSATLTGKGSSLGEIASFDQSIGANGQAAQAKAALAQAQLALASVDEQGATTTAVTTGSSWQPTPADDGSRTITFSFASSPGAAADPFSSYIGSQYQATIEKALQAWSNATGLTFEEVADSPASNIRIGFSDFDTASSGILGYTDAVEVGGAIQSAVIRLEDPSETALSTGADSQATYTANGATLYQVALHEVGRALGFADNADPTSVLSPYASSLNQTLDATDLAGATILYGAKSVTAASTSEASSIVNVGGNASELGSLGLSSSPLSAATSAAAATTASASAVSAVKGQAALSAVSSLPATVSSAATSIASLNQMIQAMATFAPQPSSASLTNSVVQNAALAQQLAAPLHHA